MFISKRIEHYIVQGGRREMNIKCCILNLEPLYNEKLFEDKLLRLPETRYWKIRKEKINKYRFREDKIRSLGAGILLFHILQTYGKEDIDIECNPYGKPYLCNSEFQFNLSHSGNFVVCSYGQGDSGIDIESYQSADLEIAKRFFNHQEYQYVKKCGTEMFIRLWSLKESYIKAKGKGLKIPLNSFQVCPGPTSSIDYQKGNFISAIANQSYVKLDAEYHFTEFCIDDFHVSVCSKNLIEEKLQIIEMV